jgi:excinuclease ABC subunit C
MAQGRRAAVDGAADLKTQVSALPNTPGVYLFRDAQQRVVYVGKANALQVRVRSYFRATRTLAPRTQRLVRDICSVEYRPAGSEAEALVYEAQLIKHHQPPYNVLMRDDKSYPLLKVTMQEDYPRLILTRHRRNDGAEYFGPFTDVGTLREALQLMRRVFPLRTCNTLPKTACLEYYIGQCVAPCVGHASRRQYTQLVKDLLLFLRGQRDTLLKRLTQQMERASRAQRYEEAARVRDTLRALTSIALTPSSTPWLSPLEQLQRALRLQQLPRRIEAFDISNLFGRQSVGSMVTFVDGKPYKNAYRHFVIRGAIGIDDYRMMREVVERRYSGSLAQQLPTPDLIIIDGGKGHLSSALKELRALSLGHVPTIGIAKQFEYIFMPDQPRPVILLPESPVLHLVQRIRDEAHRCAIQHHRKVRGTQVTQSALDGVPGIGLKRKAALLKKFRSLDCMRNATVQELAQVVGQQAAGRLYEHLSLKK